MTPATTTEDERFARAQIQETRNREAQARIAQARITKEEYFTRAQIQETQDREYEEARLAQIQEARNREAQDQAAQARTVQARKKPRPKFINPGEAALLIFAAVICDLVSLLSAIPVLGSIIGGVIWLAWFIWLKLKQAKGAPRTWSRLLIGGGIIEIIPFLGVLPTWIAFILIIIILDAVGKVPIFGKAINMGKV